MSVVVALLLAAPVPAAADHRSPLSDVVASPAREPSPFTASDAFCVPERLKTTGRRLASAPGVTARSITVAFITPPPAPNGDVTAPGLPVAPAAAVRTFGRLVNQCGGILGRKVDVDVVPQTSDPRADCARLATVHAFVVVAWTRFGGTSCVTDDLRTVIVATGDRASNASLRRAQGRLAVASGVGGVLPARVLDLVQSGRLDRKRVAVIATPGGDRDAQSIRALISAADPKRKIALVAPASSTPNPPYDVAIATSFAPSLAALAHAGQRPVDVYFLGDGDDGGLDAVRATAGPVAARAVGAAGVYAWIGSDLANFRTRGSPTRFTTTCNRAVAPTSRAAGPTTSSSPTTTTTVSSTLPGGPYRQIADVCLAWRVTARALYNAGPDPTQRSLVRALYRLPLIDNVAGGPDARPNQVINEPLARAGLAVYLAKAEYPCVHPAPPGNIVDARMCWVPVSGWEHGHAVNARIGVVPSRPNRRP